MRVYTETTKGHTVELSEAEMQDLITTLKVAREVDLVGEGLVTEDDPAHGAISRTLYTGFLNRLLADQAARRARVNRRGA